MGRLQDFPIQSDNGSGRRELEKGKTSGARTVVVSEIGRIGGDLVIAVEAV